MLVPSVVGENRVSALADYLSIFQDHDQVRVLHGIEAMRYRNNG